MEASIEERLGLSAAQRATLEAFAAMATELNRRLNLYSRASTADFWTVHVQHSLALGLRPFQPGITVVDWGTGGGLPGLPLAIAFPATRFVLVDSVAKKVQAVRTMARRLDLDNVETWTGRAETWDGRAEGAVSRATAPLATLWEWTVRVLSRPEGELRCLKGGDLRAECEAARAAHPDLAIAVDPLEPVLGPVFRTKMIVTLNAAGQAAP